MSLKNRVGTFLFLTGVLALFVFTASIFTPTQDYDVAALVVGVFLIIVGWSWRRTKGGPAPAAPPPPVAGPPRAAAPPAAHTPPGAGPGMKASQAVKKQGLRKTLLHGPPARKTAPPPKPAAPPAAPAKNGVAGLFGGKGKK
jgi:hypothetical protein